jgi:pimeloyl-ACP methyl ester carboxylesterase
VGLFRFLATTGERFRATLPDETDDAVLSIGGEKSLGNELAAQMKLVATDVTVVVLKDAGHWILEERPKETTDALVKFL